MSPESKKLREGAEIPDPIRLRPTTMSVDLDALEANFRAIAERVAPAKVMPAVKANAYGLGLIPCARLLEECGAPYLGVAFVEEGILLRQAGIEVPILVMGGVMGEQICHFLEHDLDITASSVEKLQRIEAEAKRVGRRARVQLKVDTGMERIGVHYYSADKLFEELLKCKHCEVKGVFSHFAAVRERDAEFTNLQLERFLECTSFFEKRSLEMPMRHISATAGILASPQSNLNMVRPGIGLYGIYPSEEFRRYLSLAPVASLRSRVAYFKVIPPNTGVSYGLTWSSKKQTRVVTVPLGYGDGYQRSLSNQGQVLIRGKRYPIVGKICMDQLMVDIGDGTAYNGDEVVLFGSQEGDSISVEEVAEWGKTITHEIICGISPRVPRHYYRHGKLVAPH